MSGGGAGPIILKLVREALSVGVTKNGSVRLWHVFAVTHVAAFVAGAWLF